MWEQWFLNVLQTFDILAKFFSLGKDKVLGIKSFIYFYIFSTTNRYFFY